LFKKELTLESNVCFMDMRAEKALSKEDPFKFVMLGGILGDHPPKDRAHDLRG